MTEPVRIRTLPVAAHMELPAELVRLHELAYNLWWSWSPRARQLFARLDPAHWATYRNPVEVLINLEPQTWSALVHDEQFLSDYDRVVREFDAAMSASNSIPEARSLAGPIAYFCSEFGFHESLRIYSGGLGVLSGDYCKSASDLGVPSVGVGLLYKHGYFSQAIDADGMQQHHYPTYDFARLPMKPVAGPDGRQLSVSVEFPGRLIHARVWCAQVGRVPVLLLDSDVPANDPADRPITGSLYVRGREMRLCQELLLGVGGVRALRACGIQPAVWHMNEGHSVFLVLERAREMVRAGAIFREAHRLLARNTAFTTHTPVPAGNESFEPQMVARYLADPWCRQLGTSLEELMQLGENHGSRGEYFNLTAMALRSSTYVNGVSQLHAEVSRKMWSHISGPESTPTPIDGITNGIHTATWLGPDMRELIERHLGRDWERHILEPEWWQQFEQVPNSDLWEARLAQKTRLARFSRNRVRRQYARHGNSPDELRGVVEFLDPEALTIGFARRFATYKRAALLFRDVNRLRALLNDPERPVQLIFAGKAHPADRAGQELVRKIFNLTREPGFHGKLLFLENYDMRMGRMLVQGVDVWLNTPLRPQEASGTSGMKSAANGGLQLSVPDGWWVEGYDGRNGWCIGDGTEHSDREVQDRLDAERLYSLLEDEVIPLYHSLDESGLRSAWLERVRDAIRTILPVFSSHRMVRDYAVRAYGLEAADQLPAGR